MQFDARAMVSMYESGMTVREIGLAAGVSAAKAYYLLRDAGCVFRNKGVPKGWKHTQESKEKISRKQSGKVLLEETRAKMSIAKKCHFNGMNGYGHTKVHNRGYILAYAPEHPHSHKDGYVMLHTIIMERHIGRYLEKNEVVHHINHDRKDNRLENLQLMDKHEHCVMHMLERKRG